MSPKRKLVQQKGYTTEQKIATVVAVILVIGYILLNGYTQSLGIQVFIDAVIPK